MQARGSSIGVMAMAAWLVAAGCSDSPSSPNTSRGTIAGAVRDGTTGVAGATLSLSGGASRTTTSAANGTFSFPDLAAGSYSVTLTPPTGFALAAGQAGTRAVTLNAGQTATVDFAVSSTSAGNVVTVNVAGLTFSPATVTVAPGTTVRWVNSTSNFHTVTPSGHSEWTGTDLPAGSTFQHTFNTTGTFAYFCTPHQAAGMTGTVHVQ